MSALRWMRVPGSVRSALVSLTLPAGISSEFRGERKMHCGPAALGFMLGCSRRRGILGRPTVTSLDFGQDTFSLPLFPSLEAEHQNICLWVQNAIGHWFLQGLIKVLTEILVPSWDSAATPALRTVSRSSASHNDFMWWSTRERCCSEPADFYRHLKKAVNTSVIAAIHEWKQPIHVLVHNWKW